MAARGGLSWQRGLSWRPVLMLGITSLALGLPGCKSTDGLGDENASETFEIGGDPSSFSCDVVQQQLKTIVPQLKEAEENAKESGCLVEIRDPQANTERPPSTSEPVDPMAGISLTQDPQDGISRTDPPERAQPLSPQMRGRCAETMTYINARRTYVNQLINRRDDPRDPCPEQAENWTLVYDFPTCGVGNECSDRFNAARDSKCWQCVYGAMEKSRITCQSEDAARDSVQIWCRRNGHSCGETRARSSINCQEAPAINPAWNQERPRVSGQMSFEARSAKTSIYLNTEVRAKAGTDAASVSGKIKAKVGLDLTLGYDIMNTTDDPTWVQRGDRIEAGMRAKFRCTINVTAAGGVGLEGSTTFGISFLGNGVTNTTSAGVDGDIRGSNFTLSRSLVAAGKTSEQMRDECVGYLTPMLSGIMTEVLASVGLAERLPLQEAAGKVCFEDKECPDSNWQRWRGRCSRPDAGMTVGTCKMYQSVGGSCNQWDDPPCDFGSTCELQSWMSFLGWKFNKHWVCRQIVRDLSGRRIQ